MVNADSFWFMTFFRGDNAEVTPVLTFTMIQSGDDEQNSDWKGKNSDWGLFNDFWKD